MNKRLAVAALVVGGLAAAIIAFWAVQHDFAGPQLPGRGETDLVTNLLGAGIRLSVWGFGLTTMALLAGAAWGPQAGHHHELDDRATRLLAVARATSMGWFVASAFGAIVVTAADDRIPLDYVLVDLGTHLTSSQTAQLWLLQAVLVLVVSLIIAFSRRVGGVVAAGYVGMLALLPHTVVGLVSVGQDHDLATDAILLLGIAAAVTWPMAISTAFDRQSTTDDLRRYRRLSLLAAPVILIASLVIGWQELAGTSPLASASGVVVTAMVVAAAVMTLLAVARALTRSDGFTRASLVLDILLAVVQVGLWVASEALTPPRFSVPQNIQINYLGYTVTEAPTLATLLLPGRPSMLLVCISAFMLIVYLAAVWLLRRRGDRWPRHRTVLWVLGWLLIADITGTGLWKYAAASFSLHMVVHMTSNMIVPVLVVTGAPITLALRVLPSGRDGRRGSRELLSGVLAWKPLEYVMHPLAVWFYFVSAFYLLYFSPLFGYLMRFHWGHQLMTLHFMFTGIMFFGVVVGEDRPPRELPHVGKLGFLFAAMPFHAFFAVILMMTPNVVGEFFYKSIGAGWVSDLHAEQNRGGAITWATGEIPMLLVIIFLFFQWQSQERRESRRLDRAMDSGLDDSFDAYNQMLAAIAERDAKDRR